MSPQNIHYEPLPCILFVLQVFQRSPTPQTSNWSGTIFCRFLQQTGSRASFGLSKRSTFWSMVLLKDHWVVCGLEMKRIQLVCQFHLKKCLEFLTLLAFALKFLSFHVIVFGIRFFQGSKNIFPNIRNIEIFCPIPIRYTKICAS